MKPFTFESDAIDLPKGAWAGTHRRSLRQNGNDILSLTQGSLRNYVFPLYTPAGYAVTTEGPADHPHHNSLWIASDHVHCHVPAADGKTETYAYNFYVNHTFQGRAPGRILETAADGAETDDGAFAFEQQLDWTGPAEWGAEGGRIVAKERRAWTVKPGEHFHVIDLTSCLRATDWDLSLGPTRHAYFNLRIAESMRVTRGGKLIDADGAEGGDAVSRGQARWVDYSGPVGGGHTAGVTLMAGSGIAQVNWFATDWGVVTLQPLRDAAREIKQGDALAMSVRLIVHDGVLEANRIDELYEAFAEGTE